MSSSGSHTVHIRAKICLSGRRKRTIRDPLGIQPESIFLGIVLASWERAGDDFALVAVTPALHVLVGVVGACRLAALEIRVVEDFLGVGGWEARDDYVAIAVGLVFFVCHFDSLPFGFVQEMVGRFTSRFWVRLDEE